MTEKLHEPAGDVEYRVFESLHRYESSPLDARTDHVADSSQYWRRETVSFRAAYGQERVVAHLFLPRNASPPYQTAFVIGGSTIMSVLRRVEDFDYPFEFIVRSGRAVVIPALSGTLERGPSPVNDGGHRNLVTRPDLIGEVLDWLDRYLGPTQPR